ncbi:MAG: YggS family pyridoxal phosphate-dependent enzyme [Candidatus Marinimicrobia bacterium]|nr:YggS family pyridoxal phosphate-dependent enzyme [Candidatus Neomarinimicrobiota bacterium]MDD5539612.1 YggS family pyridoxal phosphate-dependent enzyme [Candidatus Neomarinimicrobiota bacterium]
MNQQTIRNNLLEIMERITRAAEKSGRKSSEIEIIAVTKNVPESVIRQAYQVGLRIFGENRIQEAIPKIAALKDCEEITWHMIGHLQSNKARKAAENFAMIQSVDSLELACKLARIGYETDKHIEILLEVNVSSEATKSGVQPINLVSIAEKIAALPEVTLRGLMTIGPLTTDKKLIRKAFITLRQYFEKISLSGMFQRNFNIISMGMTDDYDIAVEEGSNMVRIGRGIFAERTAQ